MAELKTTYASGDPLPADDVNSIVSAILQNAHNVIELFLENFFAGKATPFNGLFFDGFSDTSKADLTETALASSASSGQAILEVEDTAGFEVGHEITIYDTTNKEEKVILTVDSGIQLTLTTNLANTFAEAKIRRSYPEFDTGNRQIKIDENDSVSTIQQEVTFDAVTTNVGASGTTISLTHTASGSNRLAIAVISYKLNNGAPSITYGGVPMTQIFVTSNGGAHGMTMGVFRLINPPTSAESVVATWTGNRNPTLAVMTFTNVDQTTPIEASNSNTGTSTSPTVSVTTVTTNALVFAPFGVTGTGGGHSGSLSGTERYNFSPSGQPPLSIGATTPTTTPGGVNLTGSLSGDIQKWVYGALAIRRTSTITTSVTHNKAIYYSKLQSFQQAMSSARMWITRNLVDTGLAKNLHALSAAVASSATTLKVDGDQTVQVGASLPVIGATTTDTTLSGSVVTMSHEVVAGDDRVLVVAFQYFRTFGFLSTVKYAGQTMTIAKFEQVNGDLFHTVVIATLVNPPVGTADVEITLTDPFGFNLVTATNFTDADQVNPVGATGNSRNPVQNANAETSASIPLTTLFPNSIVVDIVHPSSGSAITATNGQTIIGSGSTTAVGRKTVASPSLETFSYSWTSGSDFAYVAVEIKGVQTQGTFADGDTIDIRTADNLKRERKTISGSPSFDGSDTTITFTPATTDAFTTSDFVERVDILPEISIVDKGASESFSAPTFVQSIVDFANDEVEDEYTFTPGAANEDVTLKVTLDRNSTGHTVASTKLGVSLNT